MARIFKPVKGKGRKWYIDYIDGLGIRRRVAGFRDKAATEQRAAELVRNAEREVSGLVDKYAAHRKRPLTAHVADWKSSLTGKGLTANHVDLVTGRATKFCDGCRFVFWSDVSSAAAWRHVGKLRDDGKKTRTRNHCLRAIRQFTKWMADEQRAPSDPLAGMKLETVTDEFEAGVFEIEELLTLLSKTEAGPDRRGMTGFERRLLYEVAASTGFRNTEARLLTWSDVDLESDQPTVRVTARRAKNRKEYAQPLTVSLAAMLARHKAQRVQMDPEGLIFAKTPDRTRLAAMLREDMSAAEIDVDDAAGRPRNFHSFRHSFGSNLSRSGVTPKLAMELMRHSDINLTLRRYTHTLLPERAAGIDALPDLDTAPDRQELRTTGTCDIGPDSSATGSAILDAIPVAPQELPVASGCTLVENATDVSRRETPTKQGMQCTASHPIASPCTVDSSLRPAGLEPATPGLGNRCSIQLSYERFSARFRRCTARMLHEMQPRKLHLRHRVPC